MAYFALRETIREETQDVSLLLEVPGSLEAWPQATQLVSRGHMLSLSGYVPWPPSVPLISA